LNTIIYTTMIKAYSKAFRLNKAMKVYETMLEESKANPNVAPNSVTYNSLLDCCVRCFDMPLANSLFVTMLESKSPSLRPDLITYSTLIKGFCKERNIEQAFVTLQQMEKQGNIKADEVLYNSLLDGCCKSNEVDMALKVYQNMRTLKIRPSNVTYSILVKIYAKARDVNRALQVLEQMKRENLQPGLIVYTCLI